MIGEVHDIDYPMQTPLSDTNTNQSALILLFAVIYLAVYYAIIIPFDLMPAPQEAIEAYDDGYFRPRFSYFRTFRQYENLHMFFWLSKDLCWNRNFIAMWFLCLVPTVLLAADFFFISAFNKVRQTLSA